METIINYTNTKCELEMAKTRLNVLMDKKEMLYCKYFPITPQLKEVNIMGGKQNNDKMADYVYELHEVDIGTGKSLAEEIEYQQKHIAKLQSFIDSMDTTLSKMSGIEYQLFYEIVYKGTGISRAVEKIAEDNIKDTQTIWKNYYRKIKKYIKKIKNFQKIQ